MLVGVLLYSFLGKAQTYSGGFSWATSGNTSSTSLNVCGEDIQVTLRTSSLPHRLDNGNRAYFPADPGSVGPVRIELLFSKPILDLKLLINDFDETVPGGTDDGTPSEYGSNFMPAFSSIAQVGGFPVFQPTNGNTGVDPAGRQDARGWVNWAGKVSSISFIYNRPDARANNRFGLLMEQMQFTCKNESCSCPSNNNILNYSKVYNSGTAVSRLVLNSGGKRIKKLQISLVDYKVNSSTACMDFNKARINEIGKIISSLPSIDGVQPSYVGSTGAKSAEIEYDFSNVKILNHSIILYSQFPPVLNLSCCENKVDYCFKKEMIDENCQQCEYLVCSAPSIQPGDSFNRDSGGESINSATQEENEEPLSVKKFKDIKIYPNPTNDQINIELASNNGKIEIFDISGKIVFSSDVEERNFSVDLNDFEKGTYLLKHIENGSVLTKTFIKH